MEIEMPTIAQKRGTSSCLDSPGTHPSPTPHHLFFRELHGGLPFFHGAASTSHIELENAVSPPIDCRGDRLIRISIASPGIAIGIFAPRVRASQSWLLPIRLGTNVAMSAMGCVHETGSLAGQAWAVCFAPKHPRALEVWFVLEAGTGTVYLGVKAATPGDQHASKPIEMHLRRCGSMVHQTSYKQARRKRHACEGEYGLGASPSDLGQVERKKKRSM